ncbi:hypothetical protein [Vannielia litorea]|uniref:Translocase n=1 Tax=Vannielia litorea TaxID=1217970 RepID=A0A1N6HHW6_9RHOB|nr:hypothetical protein [Vannielia litorea]SIO19326.1 hypothetical protein SAMN05444002_3389 [Vannielia litorea]
MKIDAKLKKRLLTAGSVFAIALGTGFIMQKVGPMAEHFGGDEGEVVAAAPENPTEAIQPLSSAPHERPAEVARAVTVPQDASETASEPVMGPATEDVPEASAAPAMPREAPAVGVTRSASLLPIPALPARAEAEEAPVQAAALATEAEAAPAPRSAPAPATEEAAGECALKLDARSGEAAMVRLSLSAPCNPGEPITFKHGPLTFTEVTDNEGMLAVDVPALAAKAAFEARLDTGERAMALTLVPGFDAYRRTALSWEGTGGIALHAFENGADYDTEGHVDAKAPAAPARALAGEGGYLTLLGAADVPGARMAEVYSYPKAAGGSVHINVEAEVTADNCGRELSAKVLTEGTKGFAAQSLSVTMPGCDTVGEYLVFSNILPDIRLAAAE